MSKSATPFKPCPWIHHGQDRFVGRRRELEDVLDALGRAGAHRLLTLTGRVAVGKTALAAAAVEQAHERGLFPGGIVEISCEQVRQPELLLVGVLEALDVAPEEHKGDLVERIREAWEPQGGAKLLVWDHLDVLTNTGELSEMGEEDVSCLVEKMLSIPDLRILATCRRRLDVGDLERVVEVGSLSLDEGLDVFLAWLDEPEEAAALRRSFAREDDPLRRVLRLVDRRPLALRLLARRLSSGVGPGELHEEVLRCLHMAITGLVGDVRFAERVAESSFEHLVEGSAGLEKLLANGFPSIKDWFVCDLTFFRLESEKAGRLFPLLSLLPGGVWCGRRPERWIEWEKFFMADDWKAELQDLYEAGLVELEVDPSQESEERYRLLPALSELSRKHYQAAYEETEGDGWEKIQVAFWGESLELWETMFNQGPWMGGEEALAIFRGTQANLVPVVTYLSQEVPALAAWFFRHSFTFLHASRQWTLARDLGRQVVASIRGSEDLDPDLAPCLSCLGIAENALGRHADAIVALREAVALFDKLSEDDAAAEDPRALACSQLGEAQRRSGEYEQAIDAHRKAFEIWQRLAEDEPDTYKPRLADALGAIGGLHHDLGQREAARDAFGEALEVARGFAAGEGVAKGLHNLAVVQNELGEHETALETLSEALGIYRRLAEEDPSAFEREVATVLNSLGSLERTLGDLKAARELFQESFEIYERLAGERPLTFEPELALSLNNLAIVASDLNEPETAQRLFKEALAIQRRLATASPAQFESGLALTLSNLGTTEQDLDQPAAAVRSLEEALAIRRRLAEQHPDAFEPQVAATLTNLGDARQGAGDTEAARALMEEAYEIYRRLARGLPAAFEPDVAMALNNLGTVKSSLGAHDEALRDFDEALDIYRRLDRKTPSAFKSGTAMTLTNLGQLMTDTGEIEMARSYFLKAVKHYMALVHQDVDAHLPKLTVPLRKYVALTPETADDEMWQLWRGLEEMVDAFRAQDETPRPEDSAEP